MPEPLPFDAVVVAGGRGARLGGIDKAELVFEGIRLIDRVIDAVSRAERTIAVGPRRPTRRSVTWTREEPQGGGPAAAVAAGLGLVESPKVVVVAVDMPLLDAELIERLVATSRDDSAAVAVDAGAREQPLLACYPASSLRAAIGAAPVAASSMMELLRAVGYVRVPDGGRSSDCDTRRDLEVLGIERGGGRAARMA